VPRLGALEQSVEAAKQRLGKFHRAELQYSANEEQYLAAGAPLTADSIYAATNTHIYLAKVHSLESGLSELHEQCVQAHSVLSSLAAVTPMQQQVTSFLQSRHASPRSGAMDRANADEPAAGPLRLHALLDALRTAAFELQSLGVLLPSHTAFKGTHQSPAGSERPWSWLFAIQQALKKRGVPASTIESLLQRATLEESVTALRQDMLERELAYHRATQQLQSASIQMLLVQTDSLLSKFHTSNNALYAEASRELAQCVDDFQRNSTHVNIQRLLALLQALFPSLKQLLEFRHGDARSHAQGPAQRSGWAPLAVALQERMDEALASFEQRMSTLRQRLDGLVQQADEMDRVPKQRRSPPAERVNDQERPPTRGSTARSREEELPPFQF